jgi:oligopeptide/dipeptide ABC transporter ATP-binding protein
MSNKKLVEIKNLRTYFYVEPTDIMIRDNPALTNRSKIPAKAVDDVSFDVYEGEVLGIVGESGSGKSVTAYSINRLVPMPPGKIKGGEVIYKGVNLLDLSFDEMKKYRGKEISMIFQEPMTSLNPVMKIKNQLMEVVLQHEDVEKDEAFKRSVEMLEQVGISDAEKRMKDYPHQFSGGMRQRVMIAMALACNPSLLIADEPTTALDVTIQAQILDLMIKLKNERKEAAIILITHNLGVEDIFDKPKHPYTIGLLKSLPDPYKDERKELDAIPGIIPHILELPAGCKFCTRCKEVMEKCWKEEPELKELNSGHFVRCHLF